MGERGYNIVFESDGVYLSIDSGVRVDSAWMAVLTGEIRERKIEDVNSTAVAILASHPGTRGKIAPPQSKNKVDEAAVISIARDRLTAYVTLSPPDGGLCISEAQLRRMLDDMGISYGVDGAVLESLSGHRAKPYDQPVVVAQGLPPVDGKDAALDYRINIQRDDTLRIREDGMVDAEPLGPLVRMGDVLAVMKMAAQGRAGTDVFGQQIPPAEGRAILPPIGRNVALAGDGESLIALREGRAFLAEGLLCVNPVLRIEGSVDMMAGQINFDGDVVITGGVRSRAYVAATGTIDVGDVIEAAFIQAGRDVIAREGVKGRGKCRIKAGGRVVARYIEKAQVYAGGDVCADSLLNSEIYSEESVVIRGARGLIAGGNVHAVIDVVANTIGGGGGYTALITAGVTEQDRKRLEQIRAAIRIAETDLTLKRQSLLSAQAMQRRGTLGEDRLYILDDYKRAVDKAESVYATRKEEEETLARLIRKGFAGRIHVRESVQAGTSIEISQRPLSVNSPYESVTFARVDGEVAAGSFCYEKW